MISKNRQIEKVLRLGEHYSGQCSFKEILVRLPNGGKGLEYPDLMRAISKEIFSNIPKIEDNQPCKN